MSDEQKRKPRAGRPTKLNDELRASIIADVSNGVTFRDAALSAGIDETTFHRWIREGKEATSGTFYQFYQSIKAAEATARKRHTLVISKAAQEGEWRASLEYLKRHDRETWGDNVDVTSGGEALKSAVVIFIPDNGRGDTIE